MQKGPPARNAMIPPSMSETNCERAGPPETSGAAWQTVLREAVRDVRELAALLELPAAELERRADFAPAFELVVPRGFVARMRKGELEDPLLLQVLPQVAENAAVRGYSADPLEEAAHARSGIIRKYHGRSLLVTTGACPIHCRYCFRRHFPYSAQLGARSDWRHALNELRRSAGTSEIILSGGDPLSLSNKRIADLFGKLDEIASLDTVRIHTRFPVVVPERVDRGLVRALEDSRLKKVVVIHANHPNEIDAHVAAALKILARSVNVMLNQSVLLKGVNDSAAAICALSRRLFAADVLPYYLHMLDKVAGAGHFEIGEQQALRIVHEARAQLPGYLVPKLVRELPGELSKVMIL